jgi:hypothetical protein
MPGVGRPSVGPDAGNGAATNAGPGGADRLSATENEELVEQPVINRITGSVAVSAIDLPGIAKPRWVQRWREGI